MVRYGIVATLRQRWDGFVNVCTGLGGSKDKRLGARFQDPGRLDPATLESLFNNNDLAAKICSIYPEEALRQGFALEIGGAKPEKKEETILTKLNELGGVKALLEGATWGRCFGGGGIFVGADDGQSPEMPLNEGRIRSLNFLTVFNRRDLEIQTFYDNPFAADFGKPETYRLVRSTVRGAAGPVNLVIHESRMIMFEGVLTTRDEKQRNNGWCNSILQRLYEVLRDFEAGFAGMSYLLTDAGQAVYTVKGLQEILGAEGGQDLLAKRFEMIELSRSVAKALIIDEDEKFERKTTTFQGIPEVIDRLVNRLAAASGIPVTILMGQSPAGMNATGASDIRLFYDRVKSYQDAQIKPALERLIQLIMRSMGAEPKVWEVTFNSLFQPTDFEAADLRNKVAQTDKLYIDAEVLTPEEVALNRFTADGWSGETQIDLQLREKLNEIEAEKALETAENPPPQVTPNVETPIADPSSPNPNGPPTESRESEESTKPPTAG